MQQLQRNVMQQIFSLKSTMAIRDILIKYSTLTYFSLVSCTQLIHSKSFLEYSTIKIS